MFVRLPAADKSIYWMAAQAGKVIRSLLYRGPADDDRLLGSRENERLRTDGAGPDHELAVHHRIISRSLRALPAPHAALEEFTGVRCTGTAHRRGPPQLAGCGCAVPGEPACGRTLAD